MNNTEHIFNILINSDNSKWPCIDVCKSQNIITLSFMNLLVIEVNIETETIEIIKKDKNYINDVEKAKNDILSNKDVVILLIKTYMKGYKDGMRANW